MTSTTGAVDISSLLRLDGRAALVTGGSKGIGLSIAEHLAAAGAAVMVVARGHAALDAAVARLALHGSPVVAMVGDVNDAEVRREVVARCVRELGSLDVLVNNAGSGGPVQPLIVCDPGDVRAVVEDDQLTPLFMAQAAYRAWMDAHGGCIVNVGSFAGIRARASYGAYGQAKAALDHQTRVLALELAPTVRVNGVAPGLVMTEMMLEGTTADYRHTAATQRPMRRLGEPADVAAAVLFLCSDAASWITGLVLPVEGGALLSA